MGYEQKATRLEQSVIDNLEAARNSYDTMVRSEGGAGGDKHADFREFNQDINAAVKIIRERSIRRELGVGVDKEDIAE